MWLPDFWRQTSLAYELYPWDSSWFSRQLGRSQVVHDLTAATVRGMQSGAPPWDTPAWRSTRQAVFMRTGNDSPNPWLLEDVGLRFSAAAEAMSVALAHFDAEVGLASAHLSAQRSEALGFVTRCRAYAFHIRETNIVGLLRSGALTGDRRVQVFDELEALLEQDRLNQLEEIERTAAEHPLGAHSDVQNHQRWTVPERRGVDLMDTAIASFRFDREKFLERYLLKGLDQASAGQFSLTTS